MLQTTWIAIVLGSWSVLYLLDAFLKAHVRFGRPYIQFLNKTGFSINICQLRWYTSFFNRTFVRMAQWKPYFLKLWFTFGVFFGLVAMLLSTCLLILLVVNTLRSQPVEQQVLTPVMPGVNLPVSQISYYLLTLLVCGIIHEMGHAIAAIREQVRVNGFGLFLLILYPGAYVDLSTEHLQIVSPLRQLRIYCAGVWHNFIIVLVAWAVLMGLPILLLPFYSIGSGVAITQISQNSAVCGPRGLSVGEPITSVSSCQVTSIADWNACIMASMKEESMGHCLAIDKVKELDSSPKKSNFSSELQSLSSVNHFLSKEAVIKSRFTLFCFNLVSRFCLEWLVQGNQKYACLPARMTTDRPMCRYQSDCYIPKVDMVCVYPALDNETKLLQVFHGRRPPLLFLGHPLDLHYSVKLSNYVPKSAMIPLNLPYVLETFSKYLISLSGALVILNVVPCFALDGQWICHGFIELSLRTIVPDRDVRGLIYFVIILLGTGLLMVNVVLAMWMLLS